MATLGLGIGWRPELARAIARRKDLGFVELRTSDIDPVQGPPRAVRELQERGVKVVIHATRLSLGGADPLEIDRVEQLAALALLCDARVVSDHVCFVRANGVHAGHLLPVPFNQAALEVMVENVALAQRILPVPLALENIASFVVFPGATMDEPEFLSQLLKRTGAGLILDLSNLSWNALNHQFDARRWLDRVPLERVAYLHLGGGVERDGVWQDTHAHPIPVRPLELHSDLRRRCPTLPGAMLERDFDFPREDALFAELDLIA